MVQVFGPSPRSMQAGQIGQALGLGIGQNLGMKNQQMQQGQLAKALFGDQAEQFANIPLDQQIRLADLFQKQKNQAELSNVISSMNDDSSHQSPIEKQQMDSSTQQYSQEPVRSQENMSKGSSLSDQEIAAITLKNPQLGKVLQEQKQLKANQQLSQTKEETRKFESDRDYHTKVSRPVIEAANERLKTSNMQKGVRSQLRSDIASGQTSGMYPFIIEKLGLESFRNPESARFNNAIKNLFVGSLNEIPGARPNQFIEKFLSSAQPLIGRSPEANLSVMDLSDFMEDIKDEQAKQEIEIGKEDRKKYGYIKEDITERAQERMGDFVNRRQEKMAQDIRQRSEEKMSDTDLLNEIVGKNIIPGTYVTPRMMGLLYVKNKKDLNKAVKEAESLGMRFPEYDE